MLTEFQFTESLTYADGTAIPAGTVLSYALLIDTVNPPVKSYPVPQANVDAADANHVVTVKFSDIGFTPAYNTPYFVAATEATGAAVSVDSTVLPFEQVIPPAAPTGLLVK